MALRLKIVTPQRVVVDTEVTELAAPGVAGEFGVLPEHVTFLGGLDVGVLEYTAAGKKHRVVVSGGYAEVRDDTVTILADDAEASEKIDAAAARERLAKAEAQAKTGGETPEEVDKILAELKRAEADVQAIA